MDFGNITVNANQTQLNISNETNVHINYSSNITELFINESTNASVEIILNLQVTNASITQTNATINNSINITRNTNQTNYSIGAGCKYNTNRFRELDGQFNGSNC